MFRVIRNLVAVLLIAALLAIRRGEGNLLRLYISNARALRGVSGRIDP